MSIASEFDSTIENIKSDYEGLENIGADLTNIDKNIYNIRTCLDNIYSSLPKTTGEGSNLSLNTLKGRINVDDILGDTQQDTTTGKQLLDMPNGSQTTNGITFTRNNNILTYSGSPTGWFADAYTYANWDVPIGTYTFSIDHTTSNDERVVLYLQGSEGNTNFVIYGGQTKVTITTTEAKTKIKVGLSNLKSGTSYSETFKLMFNSGSTDEPFEPYTNGASPNPTYPQDINVVTGTQEVLVQNKNIANPNNLYLGQTLNTNGTLTPLDNRITLFENPIKPNTQYTLSINNNYQMGNIFYYDSSKTYLSQVTSAWGNNKTITTPNNAYYIAFAMRRTDDGTMTQSDIEALHVQIELGSTATSYIEHQEQTKTLHLGDKEYASIGNYTDHIFQAINGNRHYDSLSDETKATLTIGKWYIEKNTQKITADKLTWKYISVEQGSLFRSSNAGTIADTTGYSNYYTCKTFYTRSNPCFYINASSPFIDVIDSTYTDATNFKNWCVNNGVYWLIPLATPTYEEITNTTLIEELNELEKMMSYNGQTNISVSGNLPMIIDVSALKGE